MKAAFKITRRGVIPLDDKVLIDLYWARDEAAIQETSAKYGKLCSYIANNICNHLTAPLSIKIRGQEAPLIEQGNKPLAVYR